jgi:DNA-binding XRE family transcriptional regulator
MNNLAAENHKLRRALDGMPTTLNHADWTINRYTLSQRLLQARKAAELRQEDVAAEIGISRPLLVAMEQGKTSVNDEHVRRLAALYHVTIGWLFGE